MLGDTLSAPLPPCPGGTGGDTEPLGSARCMAELPQASHEGVWLRLGPRQRGDLKANQQEAAPGQPRVTALWAPTPDVPALEGRALLAKAARHSLPTPGPMGKTGRTPKQPPPRPRQAGAAPPPWGVGSQGPLAHTGQVGVSAWALEAGAISCAVLTGRPAPVCPSHLHPSQHMCHMTDLKAH